MDVLVMVSNCPQMNNPCNDFNPTPLRMIVVDPAPGGGAGPAADGPRSARAPRTPEDAA
jgi:uncharacterized protein YcgI (DUF1989 family)